MTDIYKALADETRRVLLDELLGRDEQTLFELCMKLAMNHDLTPTRQAVSQHLGVLEEAGLVRTERRGRYKFHTVDTTPLSQISERWPSREVQP
ncbi:DNA-binding transcriptional ArsR family regulator [Conyzicola lurida]|uniref:DNA-binding transcriptional ArsR family regulator n=1 Tax=Conyzicola lurida TaxID=1172621 RepID=A0A841ANV5_9MICO|nr:DNA-binding transcriptional ArsR family regulator [Conyzicola lurida]